MAVRVNQPNQIQDSLSQELSKLESFGESTRQDGYFLHKVYFESFIDQHSIYRDLLSRIKAEYEDCISAIERGQREAVSLSGKLAATFLKDQTFRNIKTRADELNMKVALLRMQNQRLQSPLKSSGRCPSRQIRSPSHRFSSSRMSTGSLSSWDRSHSARSRFFPSWTVEKLVDVAFLTKKLAELKSQVALVKIENDTRFVPKAMKGQLFKRLQEQEEIKGELLKRREKLKKNIISLRFCLALEGKGTEIIKEGYQNSYYFSQLDFALRETRKTMEAADKMCEEESGEETKCKRRVDNAADGGSGSSIRIEGEDDDPTKDQEAEFIFEYIEKFFEVYTEGKIEDAVMLAAHSPKGVLRKMETLEKFKEYDATHASRPGKSMEIRDEVLKNGMKSGISPGAAVINIFLGSVLPAFHLESTAVYVMIVYLLVLAAVVMFEIYVAYKQGRNVREYCVLSKPQEDEVELTTVSTSGTESDVEKVFKVHTIMFRVAILALSIICVAMLILLTVYEDADDD